MKNGILYVSKNSDILPNGFWGKGIYSITAIVGNNGCGKTTALRLMKRLFIEGTPSNDPAKVLIVYEDQERLYIYNPLKIGINVTPEIYFTEINQRRDIVTLYYSGNFQPYTNDEDLEWSGSFEASDGWLLVHDLQDYSGVDSLHLSEPLYNHLNAYFAQNNYRICEILSLDGLRDLLQTVRLPRYVLFAPNMGGWYTIKMDRNGKFHGMVIPDEQLTSLDSREQALERLVYYDILNLIAEEKGNKQELCDFINEWVSAPKDKGVVTTLEQKVVVGPDASEAHKALGSLIYVMWKIKELCDFDVRSGILYIDVEKDINKLHVLIEELIRSNFFITARFFDIIYSHDLTYGSRLSSGEQELLNLLSRLYYGITIRPQKFHNIKTPRLLLLDEAEIGFHPEWQRQYVKILNEFISFMRVISGLDFQIVITSHSPIILSDLPVCCVNFLNRIGMKTELVCDEEETYGENVFNLYRRAFFMNEGLIGAFATDRFRKLFDKARQGNIDEEMMKEVELIGDERIKDALISEIGRRRDDVARNYYQRKLDELNRRTKHEKN